DVIIDFSNYKGKEIIMRNTGLAPADIGEPPTPETGVIMKFIVGKTLNEKDKSRIPNNPKPVSPLKVKDAVKVRNITLHEVETDMWMDGMPMQLNNRPFLGSTPTERPVQGTTEIWNFINLSPDTHPMHLHLVNFQVLDRIPFDAEAYREAYGNNQAPEGAPLYTTGNPIQPQEDEKGWKETVKCPGGFITRIIAKFDGFTGKYVYHCHILDHEENDMMQYMVVTPSIKKEGEDNAVLPASFVLHQNYPNPFNPSTMIQFEVPSAGHVELRIYDSIGRQVNTLVNEVKEAGIHSIHWNGTDSFGLRVPSGIYLCTMRAGGFTETKKMVMIK
ncbi:MAG: multicopper oxidase domain-containing protein, partial [Syntrophothermus sp.]